MNKKDLYARFMRESNSIEGEYDTSNFFTVDSLPVPLGALYKNDVSAAIWFTELKEPTEKDLLELHRRLYEGRPHDLQNLEQVGAYRKCNVRVGKYIPPSWNQVPAQMKFFWDMWNEMSSYEAHIVFEALHPFEDLNGRTGRIIWLSKAMNKEDYKFGIPFLQKFYYQTLTNLQKRSNE